MMGDGLRVLLVDDDQDQFVITRDLLADSAPSVTLEWAHSFAEGRRRLAGQRYDALLVDQHLGGSTGLDLLRCAEARESGAPAIVLTGQEHGGLDAAALEAGAVDYLVKSEVTAVALWRSLRYAVEQARVRAALHDSEAAYRATFDEAPIGIAQITLDGRWMRLNSRLRHLLGEQLHGAYDEPFAAVIHPDEAADVMEAILRLCDGRLTRISDLRRFRGGDGRYFWANLRMSLHCDPAGRARYLIAALEDVTALRQAQEEVDRLFNLSPDLLCACDFEGRFVRVNASWTRALGYSVDRLQGRPFMELVHPDDRQSTHDEMARLVGGGVVFGFTNRYRTATGDYRWMEWHGQADLDSRLIHAVARDQTDRRSLEEQLRQSQRVEAVGRLAGGIAHDFNNLLTAIISFSELTLEEMSSGDPRRPDLQAVIDAGQTAAQLTRQLLAFSRKQVFQLEVIDFDALIARSGRLLRRLISEDIQLHIEPGAPGACVHGDRSQIEQVLVNLVVNARDAMPSGGVLRILTHLVDVDEAFVARHPGSKVGPHIRLTVSDTGVGMTPEVQSRVFEPFFTTKESGKGTGLGLSTVYGIVKQSGGYVALTSAPGRGTSFTIDLPRIEACPVETVAAPSTSSPSDRATVLVVEDQAEVRNAVRRVLTRGGYDVLEAGDGPAALALLASVERQVDLVLTDVVMPGMSGRELAGQLAHLYPRLKVLFSTGYANDEVTARGMLPSGAELIRKPFRPADLMGRVAALLGRGGRPASEESNG